MKSFKMILVFVVAINYAHGADSIADRVRVMLDNSINQTKVAFCEQGSSGSENHEVSHRVVSQSADHSDELLSYLREVLKQARERRSSQLQNSEIGLNKITISCQGRSVILDDINDDIVAGMSEEELVERDNEKIRTAFLAAMLAEQEEEKQSIKSYLECCRAAQNKGLSNISSAQSVKKVKNKPLTGKEKRTAARAEKNKNKI